MSNKEKLEKIYLKIIEYGTYLALFTPLIFFKDYFFPFVVPKTIFFRIIVCLIFIAYILLAHSNPKYRPRINLLTGALALFLAVLVLTSVLGVNFERSFWSVFERMAGLLTFFHLFVFYIILTSCFREKKDWEKILSVSILVAIFASFYALASENPATRGGATLGNSSFFSSYLLFNFFFALILFVARAGAWRIFYGLALAVFFAAFFFNPGGFTKGVVSALGVGMVFLAVSSMFFSKIRLLKIAAPFAFILMVLIGIFIVQDFYFKDRGLDFSLMNIPDRSRQIVWNIAWQGWQERPWLGWGLENFNVPFIKYYNPELPTTGDVWYDRVHNVVLDTAIASGIIGLLSYLSVFVIAFLGLFGLLSKVNDRKNLIIPLGMATLLFVYFLQNLWVFDMISSYLMFFLTLAFVSFLAFSKNKEEKEEKFLPLPSFAAGFLIVLTILIFFLGNIQSARASKFLLEGIISPLDRSIPAFQKAFKASPMTKFEGPEQFSMKIGNLAAQDNQDRGLLKQGFELAEKEFKNSLAQSPLDFRLHLFLGRHYNNFYYFSGDKEKLVLAEKSLQEAFELSPTNQQVYFIFAQTRFSQNRPEEALAFLQEAKKLEPLFAGSRWYLIRSYNMTGKYELAFSELEELEKLDFNWQDRIETLREGIEIFKRTEQDSSLLIPLYEKGVELNPQDLYFWEGLVNAYIDTGQPEKAKAAAKKFLEFNPGFEPQVEELLRQLEGIDK